MVLTYYVGRSDTGPGPLFGIYAQGVFPALFWRPGAKQTIEMSVGLSLIPSVTAPI